MKITVCDICKKSDVQLSEKTYKAGYCNPTKIYDLCIECELKAKKQFIHKMLKRGNLTAEAYGGEMQQIIEELSME